MIEIKPETPLGEALDILGISFSDIISQLKQINQKESFHQPGDQILLKEAIESFLEYFKANFLESSFYTYSNELSNFMKFMKDRWQKLGADNFTITNITMTDINLYLKQTNINVQMENTIITVQDIFSQKT